MKRLKIYGPPGTGKTHTLLDLFEQELKVVRPDQVAFLTFTRSARAEALARANRAEADLPYLRTIHAMCYRLLGVGRGGMVKPADLRTFGVQVNLPISGQVRDPWVGFAAESKPPQRGDLYLQLDHLRRHRRQDLLEILREHGGAGTVLNPHLATWFTAEYAAWKRREGLMDYTDLLEKYLEAPRPLPVRAFFVDEGQDLSRLQWDVVNHLSAGAERFYLAGDDDQAIFTWAGASADLFNRAPADEERVLPRSYRLPRRVHHLAQGIIRRVLDRRPKAFEPRDGEGEVQRVGYLAPELLRDRCLILFRNHQFSARLATQLLDLGIPFTGARSPLLPEVVEALGTWQAFCAGWKVSARLARAALRWSDKEWLVPGAARGLVRAEGQVGWSQLYLKVPVVDEWVRVFHRLPCDYLSRAVRGYGWRETLSPRVQIMSIHQAKGREAETVIVEPSLTQKTYESFLRQPNDEHRVWYVAATRARERLLILTTEVERAYGF